MSVFVTVGTTSFDQLIAAILSDEILQVFLELGYTKVTAQYGKTSCVPIVKTDVPITVEVFDFKPSIQSFFMDSDLVISHAGAGSCLEALAAGKKLIVVVNENLMDNHQLELARKLHEGKHLLYCTTKELNHVLKEIRNTEFRPFPAPQTEKFTDHLNEYFGICEKFSASGKDSKLK